MSAGDYRSLRIVQTCRIGPWEIPARYKGLGLLGAATGLRPGELFGLKLRHVDLLHATVFVEQQIQQTAKHSVYVRPPKTARSHHMVPLPARRWMR